MGSLKRKLAREKAKVEYKKFRGDFSKEKKRRSGMSDYDLNVEGLTKISKPAASFRQWKFLSTLQKMNQAQTKEKLSEQIPDLTWSEESEEQDPLHRTMEEDRQFLKGLEEIVAQGSEEQKKVDP
jgi:hypothetical protein